MELSDLWKDAHEALSDYTTTVIEHAGSDIQTAAFVKYVRAHDIARRAETTAVPEDWIEIAMLPRDKYVVIEQEDGWHAYCEDTHGSFT